MRILIYWVLDDSSIEKIRASNLPLLISHPDTGLISHIAGSHLISNLNLKYIGYVDAEWAPPFVTFINGEIFSPLRIYANEKIIIFFSEVPLENNVWRLVALSIHEIYERLRPSLILGGIGLPYIKREEITDRNKLRVFIGGHHIKYIKSNIINEYLKSVNPFTGGVFGLYATIIQLFSKMKVPILIHIIDSFPYFPDIDASIIYLQHLSKMLDFKVDIKPLEEKSSQIKLMTRSMMKQLQSQLLTKQGIASTGSKSITSIYT